MESTERLRAIAKKHLGGGVWCLSSESRREDVLRVGPVLSQVVPLARAELGLSDDYHVIVKKLDGTFGLYWQTTKTAEVDPCRSTRYVTRAACHELIHASQFAEGRLEHRVVSGRVVKFWEGRPWLGSGGPLTFEGAGYTDTPWERDARERELALAKNVLAGIGRSWDDL